MTWRVLEGDCRAVMATLPVESVQCCVTSPPYWGLRDYGHEGQLGLEATPEEYVARMVEVFREVRRVLRPDGTLWLNLGDSFIGSGGFAPDAPSNVARANGDAWGALNPSKGDRRESKRSVRAVPAGLKAKDLAGVPWRVALALQADGWWLRCDVVWSKPACMPESVTDRPSRSHEYVFLLTPSPSYLYDADAIREPMTRGSAGSSFTEGKTGVNGMGRASDLPRQDNPAGRNCRSVWTISTKPFAGAHFAVMPWDLAERCVLAGSAPGSLVLDPFTGSGTVGMVARRHGRSFVGCELNPEYAAMARDRIAGDAPLLNGTEAA